VVHKVPVLMKFITGSVFKLSCISSILQYFLVNQL